MVANKKVTGKASSMPTGLAIGVASSLGMTGLGASILAKLIASETVAELGIGYGVMLILLFSSVTGSFIAFKKIKHRRMTVCVLTGLIYCCVLLSVTAACFGGRYTGVHVTALVIMSGCVSVGILGLYERKKPKVIRTKRRHC